MLESVVENDVSAYTYTFGFDEDVRKYAEETLHETEESRKQCLEEIRRWLREEKKSLHARDDDRSILPFLRGCKFNLDKTKQKLTNYYTMRKERPEWFDNRDPLLPDIQELVRLGVFVPLKSLHENRLVVIIRTAAHDAKRHKQDDVLKAGKMILDIAAAENELATIYGVTAIFDMSNISFAHYRQLVAPGVIKKLVFAIQNYHVRPKQLEFINAPIYINIVLRIFKSFMTEKLKKRINVHFGGYEGIEKFVDVDILPEEYGGNGESVKSLSDYWCEKLISYRDWFKDDEQYKAE